MITPDEVKRHQVRPLPGVPASNNTALNEFSYHNMTSPYKERKPLAKATVGTTPYRSSSQNKLMTPIQQQIDTLKRDYLQKGGQDPHVLEKIKRLEALSYQQQ